MKNLILLLTAITFSLASFSQAAMSSDHKMKDCCMMKDGKMWEMMGGKTMVMNKDMTMKNGTVVMKDGTVKMKDGKTQKLKNGEAVDMSGMIMPMKDEKMK